MRKHELIQKFLDQLEKDEVYDADQERSLWKDTIFGEMSVTQCTASAMLVAHKFSGIVYGYDLTRNNNEEIIGDCCGGHDFAVVDHYLVDYWHGYVNTDKKHEAVLDLNKPTDAAYVARYYLPREQWVTLPTWALDY
jgi:hypothetical protein